MAYQLRAMLCQDYERMLSLWQATPGMRLVAADSREYISRFLERNPGLSFICEREKVLVGTVLCGHDGRLGCLYHVAVAAEHRRQGLGENLVKKALDGLRQAGIHHCTIFVRADNEPGQTFWQRQGWKRRKDTVVFSTDLVGEG